MPKSKYVFLIGECDWSNGVLFLNQHEQSKKDTNVKIRKLTGI